MNEKQFKLIKEITEIQGTSGNERRVRDYMIEKMAPFVDEVEVSGLGNVFGIRESKHINAPRIMLASHMDEVGFLVKKIRRNGMFEVVALGGWNPYVVSSQRFTLMTKKGDYPVVSLALSPHLLKDGAKLEVSDVLFDAGFESREEAIEYGVRPGDAIVPEVETIMTANGKNIIAKAWDDRVGCAIILEVLEELKDEELPYNLIAGATVQEEVGLRGIKGAVHKYQPDIFIAVECSPANDFTGSDSDEGVLGDGFLLRTYDPSHISHKGLWEFFLQTAEEENIPYQYFFSRGGTDASAAHTMNDGIPSGVICIAGRSIHSHQSMINISDYQAAKKMTLEVLKRLNGQVVSEIYKA